MTDMDEALAGWSECRGKLIQAVEIIGRRDERIKELKKEYQILHKHYKSVLKQLETK